MVAIDILTDGVTGGRTTGRSGFRRSWRSRRRRSWTRGDQPARDPPDGLQSAGIEPEDVLDVLLSYLHWDPVQNLLLLPNATVHVFEPGLDRLRSDESLPHDFETATQVLADRDPVTFDFVIPGTTGRSPSRTVTSSRPATSNLAWA